MDPLGVAKVAFVLTHYFVDLGADQAELLAYQRDPISGEDPVRKFKVKQPVPGVGRYRAIAIDEELAARLVMEHPILHRVLVVSYPQRGDPGEVECVNLGGVLAPVVVPEDESLRLEALF